MKKKNQIPKNAKQLKAENKRLIIARGEKTFHHHSVIDDDAELYQEGEALLLSVEKQTPLEHQEHKPITLDPGLYETGGVIEFDHLKQMARQVVD